MSSRSRQGRLIRGLVAVMFAAGMTAACGAQNDANLASWGDPAAPLLLVMGGHTSCKRQEDGQTGPRGMSLYPPFVQLSEEIKSITGVDPLWVISCFTAEEPLRWYSSRSPEKMNVTPLADHFAEVEQQAVGGRDVHVIGHSHGGWLALQTSVKLTASIQLGGLWSIDPISRVHCTPSRFTGCLEPPRDISAEQYQSIADNSDIWHNFYQTETFYLRSGPIAAADHNHRVAASHTRIDTRPEVWDSVRERILQKL